MSLSAVGVVHDGTKPLLKNPVPPSSPSRDMTWLFRVIEYFAKSLKVSRKDTLA